LGASGPGFRDAPAGDGVGAGAGGGKEEEAVGGVEGVVVVMAGGGAGTSEGGGLRLSIVRCKALGSGMRLQPREVT
jgi:hypothetical protein